MDAVISLQPAEDLELTPIQGAIFNVLKATLQYPAKAQAKGIKLADDIDFFSKSTEGGTGLWEIWDVVLEIACCIPPGHPWQDSLLQALDNLRRREGRVEGYSSEVEEVCISHRPSTSILRR